MKMDEKPDSVLLGHPFAPIGRGEDIRSAFRALRAAMYTVPVRDIYGFKDMDSDLEREMGGHLVKDLGEKINIFFINGDEVSPVFSHLDGHVKPGAYNIVYPAWELSMYPPEWTEKLERFDEVWSQSLFVQGTLKKAVSKPVHYLPLSSQVEFVSFLPRRYFEIPESAYVFFFFFDFTSWIDRKNPVGLLRAFGRVCAERPRADVRLVIKMSGFQRRPEDYKKFMKDIEDFEHRGKVIAIDKMLGDNEIKNLTRACDCFISLHRSEGFGRGMAEAMCLGKPVIGTAYSGNLDFMNEKNSCLVPCRLIPVEEGQYPFSEGQVWAEPDLDHAVQYMIRLLDDRDFGMKLGQTAMQEMRQHFSYRAIGLRYKKRLEEILNSG